MTRKLIACELMGAAFVGLAAYSSAARADPLSLPSPWMVVAAEPAHPVPYDATKAWLTKPSPAALTWGLEATYQALSLADGWSTCASGKLPGIVETGSFASALYGSHPTCRQDYTLAITRGLIHLAVTAGLSHFHAPTWAMLAYQGGTGIPEVMAVSGNVGLLERPR